MILALPPYSAACERPKADVPSDGDDSSR
jgi:hypothetical protein